MHRRDILKAGSGAGVLGLALAAGLLRPGDALAQAWNKAAFDTKNFADTVKALGGTGSTASAEIRITAPDIAENGAVVPVSCATTLPGVKRLLILVEKNPAMLCAIFDVSDAVEPAFSTRVKMGQSSNVMAVAVMGDGKVLFSQKEIKVTLGGCGG